jgi:hypothetical protein
MMACDPIRPSNSGGLTGVNINLQRLLENIASHQATVGIVGQGYVGLPLASTFA